MSELVCKRDNCDEPAGRQQVVLLDQSGRISRRCGPFCIRHAWALVCNLIPRYGNGSPAYRIDGRVAS